MVGLYHTMESQSACIFCSILSGRVPCAKVFENDQFLAFLDVFPATSGHTLLIPKKHTRWVHEIEPVAEFWLTARSITQSMQTHLNPTWIQYFTHGAIDHAHLHIIPRYDDVNHTEPLLTQPSSPTDMHSLETIAEKIRL